VIHTVDVLNGLDLTVERSPTLRDLFIGNGELNGPMMHAGDFDIEDVLDHYNDIDATNNPHLDNRLARGRGQNLNMTDEEREALIAFLKTLSGNAIYNDSRWSDPFN